MNDALIQAHDLSRSYRNGREQISVLSRLSLELRRGEAVAVIGPSGSGKSTLLNLLNGLIAPDSGALRVFGRPRDQISENDWAELRRTRIATLFQDGNLIPTLTVARNIAFRAGLAGLQQHNGAELLEQLGIADIARRYPDQISGGQRQRAALACAFVMQPELILADEPTGSLDYASAQKVAPLFFDAIRERALGALIVTHNPELAQRCDRILELREGALRPWDSAVSS
ncbi:ABC transporter ATP-binding protein [Microbulbifer hydrolyticus]|uniref:ABC transport system ATP-binding protein n=1 Tax=Microbulbifer hydrolyticus TaxID=48074 RepID=A0A6P1TE64_9GAMM|nr:ABC transporter ATP-binding protein [Microbulbifer hydrolyticus]MBB5210488.1 putative ABC transport system ATP-binding protein [Microbulbifer hydrolyticus]QHQ39032.1 ATP-binding cassette domain-containing protein [Microbulbifer hydrolyticus]